jgi:hypothetical protein
LRPIPAAELNHLVAAIADPPSVQQCTSARQVRYCLYPGFDRDLPAIQEQVSGVLAHLPARPAQPLTVMQVALLNLPDATFTNGHPWRQVSRWDAQVQQAPGNAAIPSAIYLPVATWPAAGGLRADAHFDLALAAAEWAVGLAPAASSAGLNDGAFQPCVPLDQAREAIAIWLAIVATHPPTGELQGGLDTRGEFAQVGRTFVAVWAYPGWNVGGYLAPQGASPQLTAPGYLLAHAMTSLPEQKVARVLADAWGRWLSWHTSEAQLAAALGMPMPAVPAPPAALTNPPPGQPAGPVSPLCTT